MAVWWEVWGIEAGNDPPPELLMKFPDEAGGEAAAEEARQALTMAGATAIELRRVEE